jgi:formylmethanofuran dehydrogenase subunit A
VTLYVPDDNRATMFSTPRYVVKGGVLTVEEGQLRRAPTGHRLHVRPSFDASVTRDIERYFDQYGTVRFANYPVAGLRDAPVPVGAR